VAVFYGYTQHGCPIPRDRGCSYTTVTTGLTIKSAFNINLTRIPLLYAASPKSTQPPLPHPRTGTAPS